jgi:hypothetical protein
MSNNFKNISSEDERLDEFYPTPDSLLDKILSEVNWHYISTVLEPSAGKGNIVKYIQQKAKIKYYKDNPLDVDCIEKNTTLQKILVGSDYRLVHDDFLTYKTYKHYDAIIMNPPFSEGDKHLMKAMDMQEQSGGNIICILNAETLKNPCTNLRKTLVKRLEDINANIEYMENEFVSAERTTNVEVAIIKIHYDEPEWNSNILDELKKKSYSELEAYEDITDLAPKDFVEAIVRAYEMEVEAGINFIHEYLALRSRLKSTIKSKDNAYSSTDLLTLNTTSVNTYVQNVRMKYWSTLFNDSRITGGMTSNLHKEYASRVDKLKDYDFSLYNIRAIQAEMSKHLCKGVEECIITLFDELTAKHSWYPECEKNIHYFNGWATNKAWIINKKVIIPFNGYSNGYWQTDKLDYWVIVRKLTDIEKALNYLDGGLTDDYNLEASIDLATTFGITKNIHLKYFDVTFYKKGTCHLTFTNEELLKKFNIFGSQRKAWLPPSYMKKHYSEMSKEEKKVVDEFEGKESYEKVMSNADYYKFETSNIGLIEQKTA